MIMMFGVWATMADRTPESITGMQEHTSRAVKAPVWSEPIQVGPPWVSQACARQPAPLWCFQRGSLSITSNAVTNGRAAIALDD